MAAWRPGLRKGCSEGLVPASACRPPNPVYPSPGPQAEIFQAFTELFQVACARPPPLGLCDYPSSRAGYAVDLMLKWDSRPDGEGAPQPRPVYPELILQPPHTRCHASPPGTERGCCCLGLVHAILCPFSLISLETWIRGGPP